MPNMKEINDPIIAELKKAGIEWVDEYNWMCLITHNYEEFHASFSSNFGTSFLSSNL